MALDTLYTAETPEGIALSLRAAGVVSRGRAYLIDFALRLVLFVMMAMVFPLWGGMGLGMLLVVYFALEWFYPVLFELMPGGATPGKRMMGLQVVMDSGLPVTPAASVIRNLLKAADFLPVMFGAGLASMLFRPDFKRLGDLAAGTMVVYKEAVHLHGALPQATPCEPQRALTAREQAAVLAWAGRTSTLTAARLEELAMLAVSVAGTPLGREVEDGDATRRLQGVAQWLAGRRPGDGA